MLLIVDCIAHKTMEERSIFFFFWPAIVNSAVQISNLFDFVSFTGMISIIKRLECGLLGMMRFVIVIYIFLMFCKL